MDEKLVRKVLGVLARHAGTSGAGPVKTSRLILDTGMSSIRLRHVLDHLEKAEMVRYNRTDAWWIQKKGRVAIIKLGLDEAKP